MDIRKLYPTRAAAAREIAFCRDEIIRSLRLPVSPEPEVQRFQIPMRASWAAGIARDAVRAARRLSMGR